MQSARTPAIDVALTLIESVIVSNFSMVDKIMLELIVTFHWFVSGPFNHITRFNVAVHVALLRFNN